MEDTVVIRILQMRELKHPVTEWKSWDLDSGILAADLVLRFLPCTRSHFAIFSGLALRVMSSFKVEGRGQRSIETKKPANVASSFYVVRRIAFTQRVSALFAGMI